MLFSRQQRSLTRYFPEVVTAMLERVPPGTVLDGELVCYNAERVDFTALQRRIHPSSAHAAARFVERGGGWGGSVAPARLVVFDVLALARTTPLPPAARRELAAVLTPPRALHPWPAVLPATRFGQWSTDTVTYTPIELSVVVEIAADTAYEHGRWRRPATLVRYRAALSPEDLTPTV